MRVVFLTLHPLGEQRAGPAIRCWELAHQLARRHDVTIASPQPGEAPSECVLLISDLLRRKREFQRAARAADIFVLHGPVQDAVPSLPLRNKFVVTDLYNPYLLEYLAHPHPASPTLGYLRQWYLLNQQMQGGDFFLCANERQRDYWLGRFCALGRLQPQTHDLDPSLGRLLAVVPFGLPSEPPVRRRAVLRGVVPGIGRDDFVLLWAGGLWEWFDPLIVVQAVAQVAARRPEIKLVFLGTHHPDPRTRAMPVLERTRQLARELKMLDRNVFFHDKWVPYHERQDYLLEADLGVSAHQDTAEMRLAFRTRVLDYLWAGLPMILTRGDYFGDWVERERTGLAVAPGDASGWTQAILHLAEDASLRDACRRKLKALAPAFHWERVAEPLMRYCEAPYHTPRAAGARARAIPLLTAGYRRWRRLRRLLSRI
ncbi:MAG: glycosyltransferase family 4 protein [Terriglobia bacterium]